MGIRQEPGSIVAAVALPWAAIVILTLVATAPAAWAGPATGNSPFRTNAVFHPMATLPRYVRVSDEAECTPTPNASGQWPVDFQMHDAEGNACVPVFVRHAGGLAQLHGVMTVTTCTVDVDAGGGSFNRTLTLGASTVFRASDNPGVLAQDLLLSPAPQSWSDGYSFDPLQFECQGNLDEDGPQVAGGGWFPVPDASCVGASAIDFQGMVIPVAGGGFPSNSDQLAIAAAGAFPEIQGFSAVPMVIDVSLDGANRVIGTSPQLGTAIGPGATPDCVGGAATSTEYAVVVRFAEPAGYAPPVSGSPAAGLLSVSGVTYNPVCYLDLENDNIFQTLPYGVPPCDGYVDSGQFRSRFALSTSDTAPGQLTQQLDVWAGAASDTGNDGYNYQTSVIDVTFQLSVDIAAGRSWSVDLTSVAKGALATHDDADPGPAVSILEGAVNSFNVTIGPNGYGFDAAGWGSAITTGLGPATTCVAFAGSRSDANVVSGTGPGSFDVQVASVLRTASLANESAVLFGLDDVLPDYYAGTVFDDNPGGANIKTTTADNYLSNPATSCRDRNPAQDGYHLQLKLKHDLLPTGPAPTQLFTPLGDLGGGQTASAANGISADGAVVVGWSRSGLGVEAFRWDTANGMAGLGELAGSHFYSAATGASADGSVIAGASTGAAGQEAFRWDPANRFAGLGDLTGSQFLSYAAGVSADGSVVVGRASDSQGAEAFRWNSSQGMVGLGDLAGGGFGSEATAASADGSQVVGKGTSAAGTEAFLWNSASGMVGLGDLAGGSLSSEASSVSADGATVVGASSSASGSEAFRWRASTGMVGLGDLAGGNFSSRARAVSSNGSVVVGQGESASGQEAFLWTPQGGMQRLAAVLTSHGANLNGWVLRDATGISANGRSIVGYGVNPSGEIEAWVAVLPAAAPAVPLGPGVAVWTTLFVAAIGALRLRARG